MNRLQIFLSLCAILLGLALWHQPPAPPATETLLTGLRIDGIQQIRLFNGLKRKAAIQLQRENDGWWLQHPLQIRADAMSVHEILRLAETPSHVQRPASGLDLPALKLKPPLWRVQFNQHTLEIGGRESISGRRYIRVNDTVHLVADFNPALIDSNYADLADRSLLPANIDVLQIQTSQDGPARAGAPHDALLSRWQTARADWIIRPMSMHFDQVDDRVRIKTRSGRIEFLVAGREPRLQLIRPDWDLLYVLPASAAAELLEP